MQLAIVVTMDKWYKDTHGYPPGSFKSNRNKTSMRTVNPVTAASVNHGSIEVPQVSTLKTQWNNVSNLVS